MSVSSEATKQRVKAAIARHHAEIKSLVLGTNPEDSLIRLAYLHSFLNPPTTEDAPRSYVGAKLEVALNPEKVPSGETTENTLNEADSHLSTLIDGLEAATMTQISTLIQANNTEYHRNALINPTRTALQDDLVREGTLGDLKQKLRGTAPKAQRKWRSIVLTGLSDAVGNASVDRIVDDHLKEEGRLNADEVFVFRQIVGDAATCVFCRKFYGDVGEIPKVYKLSTLLGNGSNYGLPKASWAPVVGSTHPNTRTSQVIELPSGFTPVAGGSMEFVGKEVADKWISENISS